MSKSLVALDTNRIKSYVFATGKLKEIRGASALLDRLNREDMLRLVGGDLIYANGGAGLFVVNTDQADDVIQSVQKTYHQETHTASITGASVELLEDSDNGIKNQLDLIRYHLRIKKDGTSSSVPLFTHPLLRFCDSCGIQYATTCAESGMLCPSCKTKREENKSVQKEIKQWTSGQVQPNENRLWGRLIKELTGQGYPMSNNSRPEDFGELGNLSSPKHYMALIYADGDGMGQEIAKITTLDEMQRFADAVDSSVYHVVGEAIDKYLQPSGQDGVWPFDVLLLGGDDLVMVTRAQSAINVALHVVEHFPRLTRERWGKPLKLSASVVLAHINYPVGALLKLAESGLKFAKRQAAKRRLQGETLDSGLINFLVVSSANHLDFQQYYQQVLEQEDEQTQSICYRTQRPYTPQEMHDLLDKIRQVSDVPHSKLEQLRAAVFKSKRQGTIDAMMVALRSRDSLRKKVLELVGDTPAQQIYLPWIQKGDNIWVTPVLDVVELIDFVQ